MDVDEVVRRAQRGDLAALDEVVTHLMARLGRVCAAIAVGSGDDALQETLVAVVRNLHDLRKPGSLHAWARRIAVREALRVARRDGALPVDPSSITRPAPGDASTAAEVRAVLDSLQPEQRAVLVLRHVEGLSELEIAQVLQVAQGTVKSRLHRARTAFRRRWTA